VKAGNAVVAWLARGAESVIETSCARVFLAGDTAWKIKRPVNLGFLDFSTLAKRRWALDRELAFNRAAAPDIYRAVRAITRQGGAFAFDGPGPVAEWSLEMRRFDEACVLARRPQMIDGAMAETLGRLIARAHLAAPLRPAGGGTSALGYTLASNAQALRAMPGRLGRDGLEATLGEIEAAFARASPLLEARRRQGFARRCHGDLHLGNILLEDGAPKLFDCIEFNDRLSDIDVLYDLAFPLMDLDFRGCGAAANRLFNAWLDESARGLPAGHWRGLAALPLMQAARACVRAHVTARAGDDEAGKAYLAAARRCLLPADARLVAVGGLSGAGKTRFSRIVAPALGLAPGAVVLRSDEIRKRQWGVSPVDRLPAEAYGAAVDDRVHAEMLDIAAQVLDAGRSAVLDAVFQAPARRAAVDRFAKARAVPFAGVWLEGPPDLLRRRIAGRGPDASDADAGVLARQLARDTGPVSWRRLAADGDFAGEAAALVARLFD